MTRRNRTIVRYGMLLVVSLLMVAVAQACPTCKNSSLPGSGNGGDLVAGYGWSIIFMMSMPFLIFLSLGAYFYYEVCKARRQSPREAILVTSHSSATSASGADATTEPAVVASH